MTSSNDAIRAIAQRLRQDAAIHWSECLKEGLPDHTTEAHAAVDTALSIYFDEIASLHVPASANEILKAITKLFSQLDEITSRFGSGLLETDERELFVTPVIEAAEVAGLDLGAFPDGDPTFAVRNF